MYLCNACMYVFMLICLICTLRMYVIDLVYLQLVCTGFIYLIYSVQTYNMCVGKRQKEQRDSGSKLITARLRPQILITQHP